MWSIFTWGSGGNDVDGSGDFEKIPKIEDIDNLCMCLNSKAAIDEKRKCLDEIYSLIKLYKLEVSCRCFDAILKTLRMYKSDDDIITKSFLILCCVLRPSLSNIYRNDNKMLDISFQFGEIFLKDLSNVQLIFDFLQAPSKNIKIQAVKLLSILVECHPSKMQNMLLEISLGVSRLVDLLDDPNDVIRSSLLFILIGISKGNPHIQKILLFENIFQKLLKIIKEEGCLDGEHSVIDCLSIIRNLIQEDQSVQNNFRQTGIYRNLWDLIIKGRNFVTEIVPSTPDSNENGSNNDKNRQKQVFRWTDCSITIFQMILEIFQSSTNVNFSVSTVISFQNEMLESGIMETLLEWTLGGYNFPHIVVTEIFYTLSGIVKGNRQNCEFLLLNKKFKSNDNKLLYYRLLGMSIEKRRSESQRLALLRLIQCLTMDCENPFVVTLIEHIKGTRQCLTSNLFFVSTLSNNPDGFTVWIIFSVLSSLTKHNVKIADLLCDWLPSGENSNSPRKNEPKNFIFRYYLNFPYSLENSEQARIGLLSLLIIWMHTSRKALDQFISDPRCQSQLIADLFTESRLSSVISLGLTAYIFGMILVNYPPSNQFCAVFNQALEQKSNLKDLCVKISIIEKSEQFMLSRISPKTEILNNGKNLIINSEFSQFYRENEFKMVNQILQVDSFSEECQKMENMKTKISSMEKEILSLRYQVELMMTERTQYYQINQKLRQENEYLLLMLDDQQKELVFYQSQFNKFHYSAANDPTIYPSIDSNSPNLPTSVSGQQYTSANQSLLPTQGYSHHQMSQSEFFEHQNCEATEQNQSFQLNFYNYPNNNEMNIHPQYYGNQYIYNQTNLPPSQIQITDSSNYSADTSQQSFYTMEKEFPK